MTHQHGTAILPQAKRYGFVLLKVLHLYGLYNRYQLCSKNRFGFLNIVVYENRSHGSSNTMSACVRDLTSRLNEHRQYGVRIRFSDWWIGHFSPRFCIARALKKVFFSRLLKVTNALKFTLLCFCVENF